jgi:hypothetical protein
VNNEVHMFVVKDQGHYQIIEFMQICRLCQGSCTMWGMCLVPDSLCMLWKKKNWCFSCHNNEKLAIALGLINTAPSSPLRIKRICRFFKIATI